MKKLSVICLAFLLTLSSTLPAYAYPYKDITDFSESYNTAICLDKSRLYDKNYNISSFVKRYSEKAKDAGPYYAKGWVDLTTKEDGEDVYHYTKATMQYKDTVYTDSGYNWGSGKVWAKSPSTYEGVVAHVYYGYDE